MQIGFIGAGQMAQALAAGIAKANSSVKFSISDPSDAACENFSRLAGPERTTTAANNQVVFKQCELVFLAVKPQYLAIALANIPKEISTSQLVVSVMAGVTIETIRQLTGAQRIIRVMPNTPCLIGQGACAMATSISATAADIKTVTEFLQAVGIVATVEEPLLDSVTGLSGSGPAYVFTFIEALIQGSVATGMSHAVAHELAVQTVLGAAAMVKQTGEHPAILRDRVTSPGGTTIAGLKALEDCGFRAAVMSAVVAATERSRELG